MFYWIDTQRLLDLFVYQKHDPVVFTTSYFLFFFFIVLVVYRLFASKKNLRIYSLIIFSLFFYYKATGYYFFILFFTTLLNFYIGNWIGGTESQSKRKWLLIISIVVNIAVLFYFKYTNFFIGILNDISVGQLNPLDIFVPVGISFYTFKAMSYVLDIYFETMEPVKSLRDFTLFVSFFPNILAGPIDRASEFLPQIEQEYKVTKRDVSMAVFLIIVGLFKKTVIADYIGLNFVDRIFDSPLRYTGVENLMAAYGYALQLWCDFSGYTDMALGVGLLLGFKLRENFNYPYKATSIADFWRRWHMSLSTWLLDYLFKPLQMKFRNLRNFGNALALFITFTVIGIWHGANWTFILFGVIHGTYLATSIFTKKLRKKFCDKTGLTNTKFLKVFQIFFTFQLVVLADIFFRAASVGTALDMFKQIFTFFHSEVFIQFVKGYTEIFGLVILGYVLHYLPESVAKKTQELLFKTPVVVLAVLLTLMIWLTIQFKFADLQPFLYFQF